MNSVPCTLCGKETMMTGTRLCDRCWELSKRIERDPELARKVLKGLDKETVRSNKEKMLEIIKYFKNRNKALYKQGNLTEDDGNLLLYARDIQKAIGRNK